MLTPVRAIGKRARTALTPPMWPVSMPASRALRARHDRGDRDRLRDLSARGARRSTEDRRIDLDADRHVVRPEHVALDERAAHELHRRGRGEHVVDPPADVLRAHAEALAPPRVVPGAGLERAERVDPARARSSGRAPRAPRAGSRCSSTFCFGRARSISRCAVLKSPITSTRSPARGAASRRARTARGRSRACRARGCCRARCRCPSGSSRSRPRAGRSARSAAAPRRRSAARRARSRRRRARGARTGRRRCSRA